MPCPFCMIAENIPISTTPKVLTTPLGSAYPVLSTPTVVAFLDIAPVTRGHVLLCPRRHCVKATDMTFLESAALGVWLPILTRAIVQVLGATTDDASWNIIQANGSEAGQTVPHSHFHIIPRLGDAHDASNVTDAERKNLALEEGPRIKLDHQDGIDLCTGIQEALHQDLRKLQGEEELSGSDEELSVNLGNGLKL